MAEPLKLLCVLAHPDDECVATGGILAKYAAEGVKTYLITATRGEHGWFGAEANDPGPDALGQLRERELNAAAKALGLEEVRFLDYRDGELDQACPARVISKIVNHLRRIRPQVVVTFEPNGVYGHPDHIAISQFTTAAVVAAADPYYPESTTETPHRVSKLYYRCFTEGSRRLFETAFGDVLMNVEGTTRRFVGWPEWAVTTKIDACSYWPQVWQAVLCHQSQLLCYKKLKDLPTEDHRDLWGNQTYYRAFSLVNGGRNLERDFFVGLRAPIRL